MFVNDLILNACVKTTEMFICEKILTTFGKKITSNPYTNGYTFKFCINLSLLNYITLQ
jgi:hypothetical protein